MLQSYSGAMATIKVNVCRFCGNTVLPKLSVALFKNSLIFFSTKDKVSQATPIACHADRPAEFECARREEGLARQTNGMHVHVHVHCT